MKRFIFVLILTIVPALTYAGWWRTYGDEGDDRGYCVQLTDDGGYIISGYSELKGGVWLIKTDERGDVQWDKVYESGGSGRCVQQATDGGYIVTVGETLIKTDDDGEIQWVCDCGFDVAWVEQTSDSAYIVTGTEVHMLELGWVLYRRLSKIDAKGNELWTRKDGDGTLDSFYAGYCVKETWDGGYILTGAPFVSVLKFNSEGVIEWEKYLGRDYIDYGSCIQQTDNGGYIIASFNDIWLLKMDENGDSLWSKTYRGPDYGSGGWLEQTDGGGYIIVTSMHNPGNDDLWLLKIDSLGDTLWTLTYGGEDTDYGNHVKQTRDGGYIVVGLSSSFGTGNSDVYLIKTDSLGLLAVEEPATQLETRLDWCIPVSVGRQIVLRYEDRPLGFHASVFSASGRKVDELHSTQQSGTILWGQGFSPGVYFIREVENSLGVTRKVVLVK